jgi:hypothetical protein
MSSYHLLWQIKKKYGMTSTGTSRGAKKDSPGAASGSPSTPNSGNGSGRKRGRLSKKAKEASTEDGVDGESEDELNKTPCKRMKKENGDVVVTGEKEAGTGTWMHEHLGW